MLLFPALFLASRAPRVCQAWGMCVRRGPPVLPLCPDHHPRRPALPPARLPASPADWLRRAGPGGWGVRGGGVPPPAGRGVLGQGALVQCAGQQQLQLAPVSAPPAGAGQQAQQACCPLTTSQTAPLPPACPPFPQRNRLYVADTESHALREIDLGRKAVTTLAGAPARTAPACLPPAVGRAHCCASRKPPLLTATEAGA